MSIQNAGSKNLPTPPARMPPAEDSTPSSAPPRWPSRRKRRWSLLAALGAAGWTVGCASVLTLREIHSYTIKNEFLLAAEKMGNPPCRYGQKNALLFYLDRGLFFHLAQEPARSNRDFETAKQLARELYTKSVTAHAGTFLINDLTTPYCGEDFERALIHLFAALNFAALGQGEDALVECRQMDLFFRSLVFEGERGAYQDDAFARYLAGLFYEDQGEINDAHVSYMKALTAYEDYAKFYQTPLPTALAQDALRTARTLGLSDRAADIEKRWQVSSFPCIPTGAGEVVVLHYAGLGPEKVDSFFEISLYNGWPYVEKTEASPQEEGQRQQARAILRSIAADKMLRVAFPTYRRHRGHIQTAEITSDSVTAQTVLVEDVGAIAVQNLNDRVLRTRSRAIARALVKFLLAQKVGQEIGRGGNDIWVGLVKSALQVASVATEVSDKRSWRTLPDRIHMARLVLAAGTHNLSVQFLNERGTPVEIRSLSPVIVTPGRKTFVLLRTAL